MTSIAPPAQRHAWIDALKGWGIILIVVGHVWSLTDVSLFYQWLLSFHVPLFFFAAGLTLKLQQGSTLGVLRKRGPTLLIPYLVFGLLGYAFYLVGYFVAQAAGIYVEQFNYGLFRPLWGIAYGSLGDGLLVNSPIWFLPALLICTGIVYALNQAVVSVWLRYTVLLALFGVGVWVAQHIKLPFGTASAMCAALFMQLGLDLKAYIVARQTQRHLALGFAVTLFAFTLLAPINGGVGLGGPTVNNPMWFVALATAGSLASVGLVIWLQPLARLRQWLQSLGHHSMGILVLHMLAIKGVKVVLSVATGNSITLMEQHLGWGLLVLVSSVLIMWPAITFINHFAPWILGHKPVSQSLHQT